MEHSRKNHTNPTILLHLPLDSYSFFIMFLLEIETDHLLESYSNIAIGRIRLDQPDSAGLSKSRLRKGKNISPSSCTSLSCSGIDKQTC